MENNLEIDVKNAKAMGLSYGEYKALYYDPNAAPVKKDKGVKICPVCRGIVQPPRTRVCSDECAKIHRKQYNRQYSTEYYHRKVKKVRVEGC